MSIDVSDYTRADPDDLYETAQQVSRTVLSNGPLDKAIAAMAAWNTAWGYVLTMRSLARILYSQDTRNSDHSAEWHFYQTEEKAFYRSYLLVAHAYLDSPNRQGLNEHFGAHQFSIYRHATASRQWAPEQLIEAEIHETKRYTQLLSEAAVSYEGRNLSLPELDKYFSSEKASVRRGSQEARMNFLNDAGEELDRVFDDLVSIRSRQAKANGRPYADIAYEKLGRTSYGPSDVAQLRRAVLTHIVPITQKIIHDRQEELVLGPVSFIDEGILFKAPNQDKKLPVADLLATFAQKVSKVDPDISSFFLQMHQDGLTDLLPRQGKAVGGFAAFLPSFHKTYIFANLGGGANDMRSLLHELGHGFQGQSCMKLKSVDYLFPSPELGEVHAKGMELLVLPLLSNQGSRHIDGLQDARFKVAQTLLDICYVCAIDEFQHWVYSTPEAAPSDRLNMWLCIEKNYLPHTDYQGLPAVSDGRLWQLQRHVFLWPFYFIDYAISALVGLQLRLLSLKNRDEAFARYKRLCQLGGSVSFTTALRLADLSSPFDADSLHAIMSQCKKVLASNHS